MGYADSEQFHIFELTKQLPRFAMYVLAGPSIIKANLDSYVTFQVTERIQRICIWINQNFLVEDEVEIDNEEVRELHISFLCLRDRSRLNLDFESDGRVKFSTQDIVLAGNLIQSLAIFLNLTNLQVRNSSVM